MSIGSSLNARLRSTGLDKSRGISPVGFPAPPPAPPSPFIILKSVGVWDPSALPFWLEAACTSCAYLLRLSSYNFLSELSSSAWVDRECKNGAIRFVALFEGDEGAAPSEFVVVEELVCIELAPKLIGTFVLSRIGDEAESNSSSGRASILISPLVYWSACFAARCVSSADFTLNSAGQNGQRLLMTWACARNWPFRSRALLIIIIWFYCQDGALFAGTKFHWYFDNFFCK